MSAAVSAVFLDKDGTVLVDVAYNVDPSQMQLERKAAQGLRRLGALGVPLIVVSNQAGIALGRFTRDALHAVEQRLAELFIENGARLSGFYCCSHHPEGTVRELSVECECRKPRPGLLLQAAADHAVDLSRSWMIGDILDDIEAGKRAGCRTILVDNGHETQWLCMPRALRTPDVIVADLDSAAQAVVDLAAGPLHAVEHAR